MVSDYRPKANTLYIRTNSSNDGCEVVKKLSPYTWLQRAYWELFEYIKEQDFEKAAKKRDEIVEYEEEMMLNKCRCCGHGHILVSVRNEQVYQG